MQAQPWTEVYLPVRHAPSPHSRAVGLLVGITVNVIWICALCYTALGREPRTISKLWEDISDERPYLMYDWDICGKCLDHPLANALSWMLNGDL